MAELIAQGNTLPLQASTVQHEVARVIEDVLPSCKDVHALLHVVNDKLASGKTTLCRVRRVVGDALVAEAKAQHATLNQGVTEDIIALCYSAIKRQKLR